MVNYLIALEDVTLPDGTVETTWLESWDTTCRNVTQNKRFAIRFVDHITAIFVCNLLKYSLSYPNASIVEEE